MNTGSMKQLVTFQYSADAVNWENRFSRHVYINGLSGTEFFVANAGYDASLTVTISCRYDRELMQVVPTNYRVVSADGVIYELISPADDIQLRHREIKFRAKRVYSDV